MVVLIKTIKNESHQEIHLLSEDDRLGVFLLVSLVFLLECTLDICTVAVSLFSHN